MNEFKILSDGLENSGCAKKKIGAATYVNGVLFTAFNSCQFEGDGCPRLNLPTWVGYELCKATHAEETLATLLREMECTSDGVAWVFGHYYACEPCASALKVIGVKEIRIMEEL